MASSVVPPIGIDLGTTFSSVAVYRKGKSEIIANKNGDRLTPSLVFYDPNNSDILKGTAAEDVSTKKLSNLIFDVKRFIGRKYDDIYVQQIRSSDEHKFKIVEGANGEALIELRHNRKVIQKTPEEISAELLKYLKESASEFLDQEVTEAVISIPAYFSNAQRKATKTAAELAGLKVLKLISEPVAAALHYTYDRVDSDSTLLVFDFGGGTLDVSIIRVDDKTFKVQNIEGDTWLGGRDIDGILFKHFKSLLSETNENISLGNVLTRKIIDKTISLKKRVSTQQSFSTPIDYVLNKSNNRRMLRLTRSEMERKCEHLFDSSIALVEKCLENAKLTTRDIDCVVLVGGSTRIPKVRELLTSHFGKEKIRIGLNPDEAVALGAALQAAVLKEKGQQFEKYQINEVTPLSLGISLGKGLMGVVLKKNSSLPIRSEPYSCTTCENDQTRVCFVIVEGERKNCDYNNTLSTLTVTDLPLGRAGHVKLKVIFSLDADGILEVEACTLATGKVAKLRIEMGMFHLSDKRVREMVEDAAKNKEDDKQFEIFAKYERSMRSKVNHVLYDIGKLNPLENREIVQLKCQSFLKSLNKYKYGEIGKLIDEYNCLKDTIGGYVSTEINLEVVLSSSNGKSQKSNQGWWGWLWGL